MNYISAMADGLSHFIKSQLPHVLLTLLMRYIAKLATLHHNLPKFFSHLGFKLYDQKPPSVKHEPPHH